MIHPVIMAGGDGSRLWPLSRGMYPKQFHALNSESSMLQDTVLRLFGLEVSNPVVVTNENYRFSVADQLQTIGKLGTIILEPEGKNTAPAIALAALQLRESQGPNAIMLVLASDHVIQDSDTFHDVVLSAQELVNNGHLVTFGIVPTKPETGYGYILRGDEVGHAFTVQQFVEKPDAPMARSYVESGDYYWNSGMFMFTAGAFLSELEKLQPAMYSICLEAMADAESDMSFVRPSADIFMDCPSDSVDYAVMEKTAHAAVIPLEAGWSDVGTWNALWELGAKDIDGNVIRGDSLLVDTKDCYLHADSKLVATIGVDNLIIVETKDAVLVANKGRAQDVKKVVEQLKAENREQVNFHHVVHRPWGHYDSVDSGEMHQVKRITVKPGAKLSVQMHHHRAEHWVVVSGTAKVTKGDETFLLGVNESTYIPLGIVHALENSGNIPLELIEIQSGTYLGEDDIVRFEDNYGRV